MKRCAQAQRFLYQKITAQRAARKMDGLTKGVLQSCGKAFRVTRKKLTFLLLSCRIRIKERLIVYQLLWEA